MSLRMKNEDNRLESYEITFPIFSKVYVRMYQNYGFLKVKEMSFSN